MPALRVLFACLAIAVAFLMAWILVPSSLFFRPIAVTYDIPSNTIFFERDVKWPWPLKMHFNHTFSTADGLICYATGERVYESGLKMERVVPFDSSVRCLRDPHVTLYLTWSAEFFDRITLRPVMLLQTNGET